MKFRERWGVARFFAQACPPHAAGNNLVTLKRRQKPYTKQHAIKYTCLNGVRRRRRRFWHYKLPRRLTFRPRRTSLLHQLDHHHVQSTCTCQSCTLHITIDFNSPHPITVILHHSRDTLTHHVISVSDIIRVYKRVPSDYVQLFRNELF